MYVHTDQATLALRRSSSNSTCYKKHDMSHSWLTGYRRASSWAADVCQLPTVDDQEATQSQLRRQQAGSG